MCYILDPNSDFLCLILVWVLYPVKQLSTPTAGPRNFQGRVIIVLSKHTPTESEAVEALCKVVRLKGESMILDRGGPEAHSD